MKQFIVLFCFAIAFPISIFSQDKMQEGYFIDYTGVKSEGFIMYQSNTKLCHQILFSPTKKDKPVAYSQKNIKEFYLKNLDRKFEAIYFSQPNPLDSSKSILDTLICELFIETQNIKLYYHKTKSELKRFFIQTESLGLQELISESKTTILNGSTYRYINKKYIGILKLALKDCPNMDDKFFNTTLLGIKSLSQTIEKYAECVKEKILHFSPVCNDKGELDLVMGVGLSYSHINAAFKSEIGVISNKMENSMGMLGIPANFSLYFFPAHLRKTFFMGFNIFYNHKGSFSETTQIAFNEHFMNLGIFVGYQYPFGRVKPFFGGEFSGGLILNIKTAFYSINSNNYGAPIRSAYALPGSAEPNYGITGLALFAGVDIPISKHGIRVELRYHYNPLIFFPGGYHQHSIQLQIQFRLCTSKQKK